MDHEYLTWFSRKLSSSFGNLGADLDLDLGSFLMLLYGVFEGIRDLEFDES